MEISLHLYISIFIFPIAINLKISLTSDGLSKTTGGGGDAVTPNTYTRKTHAGKSSPTSPTRLSVEVYHHIPITSNIIRDSEILGN